MSEPTPKPPPAAFLTSDSVHYRTPRPIFEAQEKRWGKIWVDVAASSENALCPHFFDEARDGLAQLWAPPTRKFAREHGWCAFGNFPYTRGEEPCEEGCRKRRCVDPTARNFRGHHITRRVAPLGEWVLKAREEALLWGGPIITLLPERPDTAWWAQAIRRQPPAAGLWIGGTSHPNGGSAARFFPEEYQAAEWREYRWENLVVDIVIIEGRVHFEGEEKEAGAGATFPSAVVTFYRPGRR